MTGPWTCQTRQAASLEGLVTAAAACLAREPAMALPVGVVAAVVGACPLCTADALDLLCERGLADRAYRPVYGVPYVKYRVRRGR